MSYANGINGSWLASNNKVHQNLASIGVRHEKDSYHYDVYAFIRNE
jgi:hypothetical protein